MGQRVSWRTTDPLSTRLQMPCAGPVHTLGGGFGWQSRKRGLTIDNLVAADAVLASGEFVQTSATQHPDLFWALRGGGGNFGVVTSFEYKLHPLGPQMLAGLVVYPMDQAKQVFEGYRQFTAAASDEMTAWLVLRKAPPLPFLPADVHGKPVVVVAFCWIGDLSKGEASDDQKCIGWARGLFDALTPHATGGAYGANYARLAALKTKYDPTNLFSLNQYIAPKT